MYIHALLHSLSGTFYHVVISHQLVCLPHQIINSMRTGRSLSQLHAWCLALGLAQRRYRQRVNPVKLEQQWKSMIFLRRLCPRRPSEHQTEGLLLPFSRTAVFHQDLFSAVTVVIAIIVIAFLAVKSRGPSDPQNDLYQAISMLKPSFHLLNGETESQIWGSGFSRDTETLVLLF